MHCWSCNCMGAGTGSPQQDPRRGSVARIVARELHDPRLGGAGRVRPSVAVGRPGVGAGATGRDEGPDARAEPPAATRRPRRRRSEAAPAALDRLGGDGEPTPRPGEPDRSPTRCCERRWQRCTQSSNSARVARPRWTGRWSARGRSLRPGRRRRPNWRPPRPSCGRSWRGWSRPSPSSRPSSSAGSISCASGLEGELARARDETDRARAELRGAQEQEAGIVHTRQQLAALSEQLAAAAASDRMRAQEAASLREQLAVTSDLTRRGGR